MASAEWAAAAEQKIAALEKRLDDTATALTTAQQAMIAQETSHRQVHQELEALRQHRKKASLVDSKQMLPDKFGHRNANAIEWRVWAYDVRNFVGRRSAVMKKALLNVETHKEVLPHDAASQAGMTEEDDRELHEFLANRTVGEAGEIVRGAETLPALEQWRLLAMRFDPLGPTSQVQDLRALLAPPRAGKLSDLLAMIQAWENQGERLRKRFGDQPLSESAKMVSLLQMCPKLVEAELESQLHLFSSYPSLKAHITNLVASRTSGSMPMMQGSLEEASPPDPVEFEGEDGELYRLEKKDGKFVPKRMPRGKFKGECFRCGREGHPAAECRARTHKNGGPVKPFKAKPSRSANSLEEGAANGETPPAPQALSLELGSFDIGALDIIEDPWCHGDPWSSSAPMCGPTSSDQNQPLGHAWNRLGRSCPLCEEKGVYRQLEARLAATTPLFPMPTWTPPGILVQPLATVSHGGRMPFPPISPASSPARQDGLEPCGSNDDEVLEWVPHRPKRAAAEEPPTAEEQEQVSEIEVHTAVEEHPCTSCRQVFGTEAGLKCHQRFFHDVTELNAVDLDLNSLTPEQNGFTEMAEITVDSGATESVTHPKDMPNSVVEPSPGSCAGQMYVGPGGEKIPNIGQVKKQVMLEHGGLGNLQLQAAKVRKPLLAVSGVTDKGNMTIFDSEESTILPGHAPEVAQIRKLLKQVLDRIPLHRRRGVFTMRAWDAASGFARQGQ